MSEQTTTRGRKRKRADDADALPEEVAEGRRNDLEMAFLEQMKVLFEKRADVNTDIAALTKQISQAGFSGKVIKAVTKRQLENEEDAENRETFESQRDTLLKRLGLFVNTPLGQAAIAGHA